MKKHLTLICGITLFALLLSACGGATVEAQPEQKEPLIVFEATNTPVTLEKKPPSDTSGMNQREMVEKAVTDLSEHLNIKPDQVTVVEARSVEWPDASLGCPQPDMAYTTVITPGFWILLKADDKMYSYHTDEVEQVILCQIDPSDPNAPRPLIPIDPGKIKDGEPWVPVD